MNILKPCPFCRGEARIGMSYEVDPNSKAPDGGFGYLPYCTDCLVHPPYSFFNRDDAISWWNGDNFKEEK